MRELYCFIGILVCLWVLYRDERVRGDSFWIIVTASLRKKLYQAEADLDVQKDIDQAYVNGYADLCERHDKLKRQLANRKGQITKMKNERAGMARKEA